MFQRLTNTRYITSKISIKIYYIRIQQYIGTCLYLPNVLSAEAKILYFRFTIWSYDVYKISSRSATGAFRKYRREEIIRSRIKTNWQRFRRSDHFPSCFEPCRILWHFRVGLLPRAQRALRVSRGWLFFCSRVSVDSPFTFQRSPSRRFLFLGRLTACRFPLPASRLLLSALPSGPKERVRKTDRHSRLDHESDTGQG